MSGIKWHAGLTVNNRSSFVKMTVPELTRAERIKLAIAAGIHMGLLVGMFAFLASILGPNFVGASLGFAAAYYVTRR